MYLVKSQSPVVRA